MEQPTLPPIEAMIVKLMAYEAVLAGLIRTHHDPNALRAAVQSVAVELSTNAMTGHQSQGAQTAFDTKIAQLLGTIPKAV